MTVKLLDGGMGTELARRGLDVSDSLWSARVLLEKPEAIEQVHYDFLAAGADCITTATYQVSLEGFVKAGLSRNAAKEALARSVDIAKKARTRFEETGTRKGRTVLVAASIGPYGAALADGSEYHGKYACSGAELFAFHSQRMKCLQDAGPDLLACETIPSWEEAEVILEVLWQFPALAAWFSFACRDGKHTVHGELVSECARKLDGERQVVAVGVNCTSPEYVRSLIEEMRGGTGKTIVVYPNAGRTWNARGRRWVGEVAANNWEELAVEWYEKGARWIGGCCGITPAEIHAVRRALESKFPAEFAGRPRQTAR